MENQSELDLLGNIQLADRLAYTTSLQQTPYNVINSNQHLNDMPPVQMLTNPAFIANMEELQKQQLLQQQQPPQPPPPLTHLTTENCPTAMQQLQQSVQEAVMTTPAPIPALVPAQIQDSVHPLASILTPTHQQSQHSNNNISATNLENETITNRQLFPHVNHHNSADITLSTDSQRSPLPNQKPDHQQHHHHHQQQQQQHYHLNNNNNANSNNPEPESQKRKSPTTDLASQPVAKKSVVNTPCLSPSMEENKDNESLDASDEKLKLPLRKNIRDVMDTNQLDTNTLRAQYEESERLARMAEQQKLLREYQQREVVLTHFDRFVNEHRVKDPEDLLELNKSTKNKSNSDGIIKSLPAITPNKTEKDESKTLLDAADDADEKLKTPSEVVTIEDSSSDDDCIVLSDDEEEEGEDIEDPQNSGLHVKDEFNTHDHLGRVVINVGHPDNEEDIYIAPQIARTIKPHQIGGIRFLFDNIIESTSRFKATGGFGCILAHSMGLGKTLQVVCFCDIFLRYTPSKYIVCVMPINTLQNWQAEFDMWVPKVSENVENIRPRQFEVFVLNDQYKTFSARAKLILQWKEKGGVLLIGYELFRLMALKLSTTGKRRTKKSQLRSDEIDECHHRLMDEIYEALVKPGPDLVICDEGHRIKNSQAGISQALKQIRTRRRIVLTGYPLQNNLIEYWCMVDFVRPNYLGTKTEFSNMFERPIQNGLCVDSTPDDIKLMRYRAHVLHSLLLGFVQRRSHTVLQQSLPEKQEFVILTRMTDLQRKLYHTFMNDIVRTKNVPNPLKAFAVCCKIWNHPDVLYDAMKIVEIGYDLDIDEVEEIAPNLANLNKNGFPLVNPTSTTPQAAQAPPPLTPLMPNDEKTNIKTEISLVPNNDDQNLSSSLQSKCMTNQNSNSENSNLTHSQNENLFNGCLKNSNQTIHNNLNQQQLTKQNMNSCQSATNLYNASMNNEYENLNLNNSTTLPNISTYPSDIQNQYFSYSMLSSMNGGPLKPNYVGCMLKEATADTISKEEKANFSSEIVDLDTKEIKTVETDIDMNKNIISAKTEQMQAPLPTADNDIKSDSANSVSNNSCSSSATGNLENTDSCETKRQGCDKILYDWATKLMKKYEPGLLTNSPKMEIFFCILNESMRIGDRVLLFSQSLLTLNLIEKFLQMQQMPGMEGVFWSFNKDYFRLDGSTASQERERLVNEFNSNVNVKLFLISTKAGSLGINLVGANRVVIFDASWNPCHDTQAIYRIYRYGQKRSCYIYRLVMDKCLEKKIYDRQIKKQGMSDRVVDECNPENHLSIKDVTNLCYDFDDTDDKTHNIEFTKPLDSYTDIIIKKILTEFTSRLTKEPFFHESLLIDRKNEKLSQAEKRLAHRSYELQKKSKQTIFNAGSRVQYQTIRKDGALIPIASVKPMQAPRTQTQPPKYSSGLRTTRWIPAEVWQKQGMTAQEMSLPLDVVIPTNSNSKSKIIIKAGQRVMVLKSTKGIYMQLDSGKIIAIRTMNKSNITNTNTNTNNNNSNNNNNKNDKPDIIDITGENDSIKEIKNEKSETETTNSSFNDSPLDLDSSTTTPTSTPNIDQQRIVKNEIFDQTTDEAALKKKSTYIENQQQKHQSQQSQQLQQTQQSQQSQQPQQQVQQQVHHQQQSQPQTQQQQQQHQQYHSQHQPEQQQQQQQQQQFNKMTAVDSYKETINHNPLNNSNTSTSYTKYHHTILPNVDHRPNASNASNANSNTKHTTNSNLNLNSKSNSNSNPNPNLNAQQLNMENRDTSQQQQQQKMQQLNLTQQQIYQQNQHSNLLADCKTHTNNQINQINQNNTVTPPKSQFQTHQLSSQNHTQSYNITPNNMQNTSTTINSQYTTSNSLSQAQPQAHSHSHQYNSKSLHGSQSNIQSQSTTPSPSTSATASASANNPYITEQQNHHNQHHHQQQHSHPHPYSQSHPHQHHSQVHNVLRNMHYGHVQAHPRSNNYTQYPNYNSYPTSSAQYTNDFPAYGAAHDSLSSHNHAAAAAAAAAHYGTHSSSNLLANHHANVSQSHLHSHPHAHGHSTAALNDFYASCYPQWSSFMLPPPPAQSNPINSISQISQNPENGGHYHGYHSTASTQVNATYPLIKTPASTLPLTAAAAAAASTSASTLPQHHPSNHWQF